MDELLNYKCIDFKKLLLIKAKDLEITDQQSHLLLIMMVMEDLRINPINPTTVSKFSSLSLKELDTLMLELINLHLIERNGGSLSLRPLYDLLLNKEVTKEKEVNLVSLFEDAFGRSLSPSEVNIIYSFKSYGFDDDMIGDALNEAVKSDVLNFRYIEKILDNWKRYGVTKRYAPYKEEVEEPSDEIKNYNWWD